MKHHFGRSRHPEPLASLSPGTSAPGRMPKCGERREERKRKVPQKPPSMRVVPALMAAVLSPFMASLACAQDPTVARSANAFNPAISLILSGTYTHLSQDPANYSVSGFALGDAASPGSRGMGIGETELHLGANIDPDLYGAVALIVGSDNTVSMEEAYFQTTGLGNGFTLKGGRFFSGIGMINQKHPHAWDFIDEPLAYRTFLNFQYGDEGLQVRWVAPTETFIELGGEALRGSGFVAGGNEKNGIGAHSLFAHIGGDVGVSQSWRVGGALLNAAPRGRESGAFTASGGAGLPDTFSGDSRLWTADFIWKWAPNGNPGIKNAVIQGEYFWREDDGLMSGAVSGITGDYHARQSGGYLQGVYQFMPRWRAGLRYDVLATHELNDASGALADPDYKPSRVGVILEFAKSQFSRFRLQYNADQSQPGSVDHQVYAQYQLSLGVHGGHQF